MTQPFTDADVELAARTLYDAEWRGDEPDWDKLSPNDQESYRKVQREVLSALAAAGRLTPADAETRTEYGVRSEGYLVRLFRDPWEAREFAAESQARNNAPTQIDQRLVGPWLPVPTEEDTDG